jgi:Doubled CXXCH motif (Paired_CXXCH_1)
MYMKKKLVALLTFAGITALGATMALAAGGIVGSIHDLRVSGPSGGKWISNKTETRVCVFCHTPHHALLSTMAEAQGAQAPDFLPLWSHTIQTNNFIPYYSASYANAVPDSMKPASLDTLTGPSRLCMSCHDGATAVDAYYNDFKAGTAGNVIEGGLAGTTGANHFGSAAIGQGTAGEASLYSVARSHPMGFDFKAFINLNATPGFKTGVLTAGYTGNTAVKVADRLFDAGGGEGYLTCATCHDVHNKLNPVEATGASIYLTLSPQQDSALCTTCHDK